MTPSETKTLAEMVKDIPKENINTKVLDNSASGPLMDVNNGTYYLKARTGNFNELQKIAANIFDQPETPAAIELQNGAATAGITSKIAPGIESNGYTVTDMIVATGKVSKTVIYDNSGGRKPIALAYLEKYFSTQNVVAKTLSGKDFSVVVGDDFKLPVN
jgi:hypothetical protein